VLFQYVYWTRLGLKDHRHRHLFIEYIPAIHSTTTEDRIMSLPTVALSSTLPFPTFFTLCWKLCCVQVAILFLRLSKNRSIFCSSFKL